jgi:hypothetical protein
MIRAFDIRAQAEINLECSDPIVFSGNGTIGRHVGLPMPIKQSGTLITARGHMHVSFINDAQCTVSLY